MRKWFKDWTPVPADMVGLRFPLWVILIGILAAVLLPMLQWIQRTDLWSLFGFAVTTGVLGVVLLFLARLPLYRQRQFLAVGPLIVTFGRWIAMADLLHITSGDRAGGLDRERIWEALQPAPVTGERHA